MEIVLCLLLIWLFWPKQQRQNAFNTGAIVTRGNGPSWGVVRGNTHFIGYNTPDGLPDYPEGHIFTKRSWQEFRDGKPGIKMQWSRAEYKCVPLKPTPPAEGE